MKDGEVIKTKTFNIPVTVSNNIKICAKLLYDLDFTITKLLHKKNM